MPRAKKPRLPSKKTVTRQCDDLWSLIVRLNAGNRCERCGKTPPPGGLHGHHIVGRDSRRLRFDERNGVALCYRDHFNWAEVEPVDFTDWLRRHRPEDADYVQTVKHETVNRTVHDLIDLREALKTTLEEREAHNGNRTHTPASRSSRAA